MSEIKTIRLTKDDILRQFLCVEIILIQGILKDAIWSVFFAVFFAPPVHRLL